MNNDNFLSIEQEIAWLSQWLLHAFGVTQNPFFDTTPALLPVDQPPIHETHTVYGQFINQNQLTIEDRLLLALALLPHWQPDHLHKLYHSSAQQLPYKRMKQTLVKGSTALASWLPSGLTYVYMYAGSDRARHYQTIRYLHNESKLIAHEVVYIAPPASGEPALSRVLTLNQRYWQLLTENSANTDLLTLKPLETYA